MKNQITQKRLKELLAYDPITGVFTWVKVTSNRVKVGDIAGYVNKKRGHIDIGLDGILVKAHHLAWLYMTGEFPTNEVDHKNVNPSDNAWLNLRAATSLQNKLNRGVRVDNAIGIKGVTKHGRGWRATASIHGKWKYLGTYDTQELASNAYLAFAKKHHGEFFHDLSLETIEG